MRRKLIVGLLAAFICSAGSVMAQGLRNELRIYRPSLSGKWKLNLGKSKIVDAIGREFVAGISYLLLIEQDGEAVRVTFKMQKGTSDQESFRGVRTIHYPDGRGDEQVGQSSMYSSVTKWHGEKLIVSEYITVKGSAPSLMMIQEYSLSPDGNTLDQIVRGTDIRPVARKDGSIKGERYFDDSLVSHFVWDRIK